MKTDEIIDTLMEAFQDRLEVKSVKSLPGCGIDVITFDGRRFELVIVNKKL